MFDLLQIIKNKALEIGAEKADEAVDGAKVLQQLIEQIDKFTKDKKKTKKIIEGPLKNFIREMYSGIYQTNDELRWDLVNWCADLGTNTVGGK